MFGSRKAKKEMKKLLDNRPKYKINEEAFDNQALARSEAFGADRAIQSQQENLEQSAVDSAAQAADVTNSTSGLLSTIAAINANKTDGQRDLGIADAQMRNQKIQQLREANQQMIDEKDKAWNFNVNEPYQNKVQSARDRLKRAQELGGSLIGGAFTVAGAALGGPLGASLGASLGSVFRPGESQSEPTWGRGNPNY